MASRITHFEIYGSEPAKLAEFYRELFGWQLNKAEGVEYWRIEFNLADATSMGGGLTYLPPFVPGGWLQYVNVGSVDDAILKAERLGGRLIREKTAVPRTAWVAVLEDPAGNKFAVWEPDPLAFPLPEPD